MNKPFLDAIRIYNENKEDFSELLKWHLAYGVVVSLPDCFMFGFFCDKEQPFEHKEQSEANCFFVTMCVGNIILAGAQIIDLVPWIAYKREFKGDSRIRITDIKKIHQKTKWAVQHLKHQNQT
jgi:hypothetical protein